MAKWEVEKGAEEILTIKCATCDHARGFHNHIVKGKASISYCNVSKCECKQFELNPEDEQKGLF